MNLRRGLMAQMANGKLSVGMSIQKVTLEAISGTHNTTFSNPLGVAPDIALLFPATAPTATGQGQPYMYSGFPLTRSNQYADFDYMLVDNYCSSGTSWDYTTNGLGWTADSSSVTMRTNGIQAGDYYLFLYKFQ